MPGFDGTGPGGMGPMTGGARGWCNPHAAARPGYRVGPGLYAGPPRPVYPHPAGVSPVYGAGQWLVDGVNAGAPGVPWELKINRPGIPGPFGPEESVYRVSGGVTT